MVLCALVSTRCNLKPILFKDGNVFLREKEFVGSTKAPLRIVSRAEIVGPVVGFTVDVNEDILVLTYSILAFY